MFGVMIISVKLLSAQMTQKLYFLLCATIFLCIFKLYLLLVEYVHFEYSNTPAFLFVAFFPHVSFGGS